MKTTLTMSGLKMTYKTCNNFKNLDTQKQQIGLKEEQVLISVLACN